MIPSLTWSVVELRLKHPFTIARGSRSIVPVMIVRLSCGGLTGFGEASPLARYGDSIAGVTGFLERVAGEVFADPAFLGDPGWPDLLPDRVGRLGGGNAPARAAIDIALHDWAGKRDGVPLWETLGLDPDRAPRSSMTIGTDTPEVVAQKVRAAGDFASLKVKMGVPGERELVAAVRAMTSKPLRVDANEGWKTREEALGHLEWLGDKGVELVEQPLPAGMHGDVAWLRERTKIPLYADEDVAGAGDLDRAAEAYDGVNVKLMKCGGIREAKAVIEHPRSLGMRVMIGCMIETSVGISAAAQLSPLADAVDLDGSLLVSNDPFSGAVAPDGTIILGRDPGIGVLPGGIR
jgi:L-alanine-DL-glutamate epimerase-like enolase superfamily enzyme